LLINLKRTLSALNLPAVGRKDLAAFDDVEVHSPDDFTFAVGDIFS